jgi:cell division protein FtsB
MSKKKQTLLTKLIIDEISGVDRGANPGAKILFWKKDNNNQGDKTMNVEELAKKLEDMEGTVQKQAQKIEKLQAENDGLGALVKMSDAEKEYLETLSEEEKAKFVGLKGDERKAVMDKSKAKKPDNGNKQDDAAITKALEDAVSKSETLEAEIKKLRDEREYDIFVAKVSLDVPALKSEEKSEFTKSLFKMNETSCEVVLKELKAAEKIKAQYLVEKGSSARGEDDPVSKLESLAKKYANDKNVTKEAAMAEVLNTQEGRELYNASYKN